MKYEGSEAKSVVGLRVFTYTGEFLGTVREASELLLTIEKKSNYFGRAVLSEIPFSQIDFITKQGLWVTPRSEDYWQLPEMPNVTHFESGKFTSTRVA